MADTYHVRVAKAEHVFSAGHFITFGGHCERLHGHNYHVAAEVTGTLDENHLVIDFLLVRAKLLEIVKWLDHYMLLPTGHPQIHVEERGHEVTVTYSDRRWIFPNGDCRILPIPNTTAELLAAYVGARLLIELGHATQGLNHIRLEVDECDGQVGIWERKLR